ncbi:dTDP-4-dehydrorhamnose reductase [Martelella sp. AD-3]|uniref:dTDP-4-dehydrorhamnose reductase n=1 Tax=Martelella sp. AD-3 TaxID=686597 RepID=UPI0004675734|nr:dTDP-4-dehydrorhamnose reductase [Martelella sp. AD-3]AMM84510.1 dTDP-4-dehydrorhamnose reductase [Martelella sp. AD-3]
MRIAVSGKNGQIARSMREAAGPDCEVVLVGRPEFDLGQQESIEPAFIAARPDVIVSAAAYTAVDDAEGEPDRAFALNGEGAGEVARVADMLNIPVLHISTDYVFDGSKDAPYQEDDATNPLSVYGASKLRGEELVRQNAPNSVILRTAWVYSPFGTNFVATMLRLAETRSALSVVADQKGCPTSALDIAQAVLIIAARLNADDDPRLRGIFNLTGSGEAVWADFAELIFDEYNLRTGKAVRVNRISTTEYPTRATRPANSRLTGDKLKHVYGISLPDWRVSARAVVGRLLDQTI